MIGGIKAVNKRGDSVRYLNKTVKEVYASFCEDNENITISKSKFSKLRPATVKRKHKIPKNVSRCNICANVELCIKCLRGAGVLSADVTKETLCASSMCSCPSKDVQLFQVGVKTDWGYQCGIHSQKQDEPGRHEIQKYSRWKCSLVYAFWYCYSPWYTNVFMIKRKCRYYTIAWNLPQTLWSYHSTWTLDLEKYKALWMKPRQKIE